MSPLSLRIAETLEPMLGPHTSRSALELVCRRLAVTPDTLADAPAAAEVLVPMLRTLLGRSAAERLRRTLLQEDP